ncbi:alpha/beta fold hydrolase [Kineosporia babensis]|uniref:Alpha/beta hydrolase n=1 Tax=Kineosporia babensis TaxID=499548 RepID=A0A9X1NKI9_9ACTN|nr:alpha/beta hydrolase [Kineosporia babensis]
MNNVPHLPEGFADTFTSRTVEVNGLKLHAVVGGQGPALLLLPGWPQFWYAWRLAMPALAQNFSVVAIDLRGMGASDKPDAGYDPVSLASDAAGAMQALGHEKYYVAGYDLGMIVGYALTAAHPELVMKLAVMESILPGLSPMPPLLMDPQTNELVWHFVFNRLESINEQLVSGREGLYFSHQFATKAATPEKIPAQAVDVYVEALRDPATLRASFEYYRANDMFDQIAALKAAGPLTMPVLAVGGEVGIREGVEQALRMVAEDVQGDLAPDAAHFIPEEAPEWTSRRLLEFFLA